jgi:hypothetical protein
MIQIKKQKYNKNIFSRAIVSFLLNLILQNLQGVYVYKWFENIQHIFLIIIRIDFII